MDNYFVGCPPRMDDGRFLSDFRTSSAREQFVKNINGIVRDDDYRMFLQKNAEKINNKEWEHLKDKNSCRTNCCIHTYPTRVNPGSLHDELNMYNLVRTNKLNRNDKNYPHCKTNDDYRMV